MAAKKKGLYANIHAKRKRIAGSRSSAHAATAMPKHNADLARVLLPEPLLFTFAYR